MGQKWIDLCLRCIHGNCLDEEDKEALLVRSTGACLKSKYLGNYRLTPFSAYVVGPRTYYTKPRTLIPTRDVERFLELLIPHDKDLTLDYLFEIK